MPKPQEHFNPKTKHGIKIKLLNGLFFLTFWINIIASPNKKESKIKILTICLVHILRINKRNSL